MKNLKFLFQSIFMLALLISCNTKSEKDCSEECNKAVEAACEEEFVTIANNINSENGYYEADEKGKLEDDVVFNIDLRNKSYQLAHMDMCEKGAFAVMARFEGQITEQYTSESIGLAVRNVFSSSKEFYKVVKVEEASKNGDKDVHLKLILEKGVDVKPIQTIPESVNLKGKNIFEKNTGLDITLYMMDNTGKAVEFIGCGNLKPKDGKTRIKDFDGDACFANMSF